MLVGFALFLSEADPINGRNFGCYAVKMVGQHHAQSLFILGCADRFFGAILFAYEKWHEDRELSHVSSEPTASA